jgi:hypothetical protein
VLGQDSRVVGRIGNVLTLYRVVGAREAALIADNGWTRLPERAAWSPVLLRFHDHADARRIVAERAARPDERPLQIVAVRVDRDFALPLRVELDGRFEYWVDAELLPEFNRRLVGPITPAQ